MTSTFTPQEATRTLPLTRAIATDIVTLEQGIAQANVRYVELRSDPDADPVEFDAARRVVAVLQRRRRSCDEELVSMGVRVHDAERGALDFPCTLDDERVMLCWHPGDESVAHFHRLGEGVDQRRPLPQLATATA